LELEANKSITEEMDTTDRSPLSWHLCHISLVHRTQFYLLLNGDPSDQVYMEVELRRLTWLEQHLAELGNASPALLGDEPADSVSARYTSVFDDSIFFFVVVRVRTLNLAYIMHCPYQLS
jgi:centromeric protein E